jgi:hypothetical protein
MANTRYVAYTDLGPGHESGALVDPADFGGEESDNFKYLLEHGNILPVSHPSAAIAMGANPNVSDADDVSAAKDAQIEELKAQLAVLEAAQADRQSAESKDKAAADKSTDASMKADLKEADKAPTTGVSGSNPASTPSAPSGGAGTSSSGPSKPAS